MPPEMRDTRGGVVACFGFFGDILVVLTAVVVVALVGGRNPCWGFVLDILPVGLCGGQRKTNTFRKDLFLGAWKMFLEYDVGLPRD